MPPTRVATIGRPSWSASLRTSGHPSHRDGSTTTSAALMRSATSSRRPSSRTGARSAAIWSANLAANGPSPTTTTSGVGSSPAHL